jgi:hypothetical protein
MALRTREALLMEEEVDHDVVRVECHCAQLIGENGRLKVHLSTDVVEQSEAFGDLDVGLLALLEGVGDVVEHGGAIPEHRL